MDGNRKLSIHTTVLAGRKSDERSWTFKIRFILQLQDPDECQLLYCLQEGGELDGISRNIRSQYIHIYIYSGSAITTYDICVNKKVKKNTPQKSGNIGLLYIIQYLCVKKRIFLLLFIIVKYFTALVEKVVLHALCP